MKLVAVLLAFCAIIIVGLAIAANVAASDCGARYKSNWWEEHDHSWWKDCEKAPPWGWGPPPPYDWFGTPPWESPHEFKYYGYQARPVYDERRESWGFYFNGMWVGINVHY